MEDNPLIIALDVEDAAQAFTLADAIGDAADFYKVGMELYASEGPAMVRELLRQGKRVFLDQKYYDIPATVERAVRRVAASGVSLLTVHAMRPVMEAAVRGAQGSGLGILAVTVLTSMDDSDLREAGYRMGAEALVEHRVRQAVQAGVAGVVCSPREAAKVREIAGPNFLVVTPGVRSAGADTGDQKRVATPAQAIADGASHLVIGRQVTRAADPRAETLRILAEIADSRAEQVTTG
jgi:orotidine-5'-phosphate decarboxylase